MSDWREGDDDDFDVGRLHQRFRDRFSREQVASHAEKLLRRCIDAGGSCFTFGQLPDGLVGHAIRTLLVQQVEPNKVTDGLVRSLMSELGFTPEWIPRRLLIREALAYAVRFRQVMRRLDEEFCGGDSLNAVIDRAAIPLDSAEAAFLLSDEAVDALIDSIRRALFSVTACRPGKATVARRLESM